MVPGSSGLEGIRPCFGIGDKRSLILLDFEPSQSPTSYRGRILEISN